MRKHPRIGDIYRNSWGYDQTNVDWYQVVRVSAKSVWIRQIAGKTVIDGMDCGQSTPVKDKFISDEVIMKRIRYYGDEVSLTFSYGVGREWDGKPTYVSWYH